MGGSVALVSRLAIPLHRLGIVLRYALAAGVYQAEEELGFGVALVSRLAIPLHRLGVVLRPHSQHRVPKRAMRCCAIFLRPSQRRPCAQA